MIAEAHLEMAIKANDSLAAMGDQALQKPGKAQRMALIRAENEVSKKANSVAVLARYMGDKLQEGHAKLFFAQAQLMKGRVAQAMNAAVEAEACFAACDDQVEMAGSRSGLSSGLKRAAPSWLAPEGADGPRP